LAQSADYEITPEMTELRHMSAVSGYSYAIKVVNDRIARANGDEKARLLVERASLLDAHEGRESALQDLGEALRLNPKDPAPYYIQAQVLYEINRPEMALAAINQCVRMNPTNYGVRYTRAKMFVDVGKLQDAYEDFSYCISHDSGGYKRLSYMFRAQVFMRLGKYADAVQDYTKGIELNSGGDQQKCLAERAIAYDKLGKKDLAAKDRSRLKTTDSEGVLELIR
jgi:tetratricopeptide (TPR) repeat protein